MKKVCHISTAHPKLDNRIFYKECQSLVKEGFDVSFIVQNDKDEIIDGVKIISIPFCKSRARRMIINPLISFSKAIKSKAKIIHFHDPEFMFAGFLLRICGKIVIYDVHEDYSGQIMTKDWIKTPLLRYLLSKMVEFLEVICGLVFNKMVVVSNTIGKKFPSKKVVIVGNMPILGLIDKETPILHDEDLKIIIYTGGLSRIRGIFEIIEAMNYTKSNSKLWLLGNWEDSTYQNECMNSKGWEKTEYIGMIPFGEHYRYIKAADIGIVPFLPVPNHVNAMPNKPFEYISCKKPIIMSNFPLWKSLFEGVAIFVDPTNSKDIAKKIDTLITDESLRTSMGEKGRNFTESIYSWEAESRKLISMYNEL